MSVGETMKRQKQNKIEALIIGNIGWCYDKETLKKHAIDYFTELYSVEQYTIGDFPVKGCFPKILSQSLRVLREKRFGVKLIKQYRPINLCTVLYKVIMKTIDIRLRQMMQILVKQNQSSFIQLRNIFDTIIIAQEAIYTMKHTKVGDGRLVNFWNDDWLPNLGILWHYYIEHGALLDSLQNRLAVSSKYSEIRQIYEWCFKHWDVKFCQIMKDSNRVANRIAKEARVEME
ncbi:hypothetical protein J1N35_026608 [Gossypium stocksii]|uniref:RNase H type-1 domain-containing protein n=1 Tax=Gossypium stocksii TaxID=47602 RepID=A0A9D3ZX95_9ROSI|nr:hypothetical protein J1N35_026608 [Gossypium stocksii]